MKPPAPPRVANHYDYWTNPPPSQSARCSYWVERIRGGWRPNSRIEGLGYDGRAEYYGVWIWELFNVIDPLLRGLSK